MTWTGIARGEHSGKGLRYPSDMTDREWLLTTPFIPLAKSGGRKRTSDMREVVNAVLYIASSGCAWRMLANSDRSRPPFRCEAGHRSDVKPATWQGRLRVPVRVSN